MKIINIKDTTKKSIETTFFTGKVMRQSPVTDNEGSDLSIDYVHFPKGTRNKLHYHSNDQVLIVTKGRGTVATEKESFNLKKGDVIWTPAGEAHWHGAIKDSDFTHISITKAHTKITQIEK